MPGISRNQNEAEKRPSFQLQLQLHSKKSTMDHTIPLATRIASLVHEHFDALPARSKPTIHPDGSREWIPMSGMVIVKGSHYMLDAFIRHGLGLTDPGMKYRGKHAFGEINLCGGCVCLSTLFLAGADANCC